MSKKKILIISYIVIMILIITFGALSIYLYLSSNSNSDKDFDMEDLKNNILNEAHFNESRVMDVTKDNVYELFDIETKYVVDVIGKVPLFNISSGMFVVVLANNENIDYINKKLVEYGNNYENEWSNYMEDQYELVKQRKIGVIGKYVYMIISENSEDILNSFSK